jgi:hypothetical protein
MAERILAFEFCILIASEIDPGLSFLSKNKKYETPLSNLFKRECTCYLINLLNAIMNADAMSIRTRPFTTKEINHRNRKMSAYNMYSALFYQDFMNSEITTKWMLMIKYKIKDEKQFAAADVDSVISEPVAGAFEVMKIAAREWNGMNSALKNAWKDRCHAINQLPVLGVFEMVPSDLVHRLDDHVMQSLTYEFNRFHLLMNQALKRKTQIPDTVKWKTFGKERFELGSKIFRSFYLNHLLKLTFFGDWSSFPKLSQSNEIVHRSRLTKVIHVSSVSRMREIFSLNGICPFFINDIKSNRVYCCGGKVSVKEITSGREGIGVVQDEDGNENITILLETGIIITLKKPWYIEKDGIWKMDHCCNDEYTIQQYDPIRIRITKSGNFFIVMNRFILATDDSKNVSFNPFNMFRISCPKDSFPITYSIPSSFTTFLSKHAAMILKPILSIRRKRWRIVSFEYGSLYSCEYKLTLSNHVHLFSFLTSSSSSLWNTMVSCKFPLLKIIFTFFIFAISSSLMRPSLMCNLAVILSSRVLFNGSGDIIGFCSFFFKFVESKREYRVLQTL